MKENRMTLRVRIQLIVFAGIFLFMGQRAFAQEETTLSAKIDAYLQPYIEMNAWSGVVSIERDDQTIFRKAYGYADREWEVLNTTDTKFRIASISKLFTQVAILVLVEKGTLSLDDHLSDFIPDYHRGEEITVRQLMTHRSGIPHLNSFSDYSDLIKNQYEVREVIDLFKDKPLDFEPGERYSYSNSGYVLLARIIEIVSEDSFENFLQKELLLKYGLKSTGVDRNDRILYKRARGYMFDQEAKLVNAEFVNTSIKIGGGSLYSTADDLQRFISLLLQNKILLKTLNELPNYSDNSGDSVFSLNGRVQGFCHQITHRGSENLTVIVLGNHYSNIALPISDDVYRIYSGLRYENPVNYFRQEINIPESALSKYEGRFDFGFGPIGVVKKQGSFLTYLPPGKDVADRLVPLGEHRFFYPQSWVVLEFRDPEEKRFKILDWIMGENVYPAKRTDN